MFAKTATAALLLFSLSQTAIAQISKLSGASVKNHARILSSDEFEGRFPGSKGGIRAANYIADAFSAAGLSPLSAKTGHFQQIPIRSGRVKHSSIRALFVKGSEQTLISPDDLLIKSESREENIQIAAGIVFAGYGIDSAQKGWNNYQDVDARGKVVLVLPGLPPDAANELPGKEHSFWATEEAKISAARGRGASAVIIIQDPNSDSSDFLSGRSIGIERDFLNQDWTDESGLDAIVWMSPKAVQTLLEIENHTYAGLSSIAGEKSFTGTLLDSQLSLEFDKSVTLFEAPNIIGFLRGASRPDESIVLTAHYDAYGIGPADETGDGIYNGAADNAVGTGALIELARVLAADKNNLDRSIVFVATTAEEVSLDQIGARYYADHPVFPLSSVVLNINIDGINVRAPTDDFIVMPMRETDVLKFVEAAALPLGMSLSDLSWHAGMNYSFDTQEFLGRNIVGVTIWEGSEYRLSDSDDPLERMSRQTRIHSPSDEFFEDWDESAIEQHTSLYLNLIRNMAASSEKPQIDSNSAFIPLLSRSRR